MWFSRGMLLHELKQTSTSRVSGSWCMILLIIWKGFPWAFNSWVVALSLNRNTAVHYQYCFQTGLPLTAIAALMVIFVQLHKCPEVRPSGKQCKANWSITLPLCTKQQTADSWFLFELESDAAWWKCNSAMAAESWNFEIASSDHAMLRQCSEQQASLKSVLIVEKILALWYDYESNFI